MLAVASEGVFDVGSFALNRDVFTSEICTVRSGTNLRFVDESAALVVLSRSGALSEDLPTGFDDGLATDVVADKLFFLPSDGGDRRLNKNRENDLLMSTGEKTSDHTPAKEDQNDYRDGNAEKKNDHAANDRDEDF